MSRCDILVYRSRFHAGWWVIDCELHEYSGYSRLFSGAVGQALLHRGAALR